MAHKRQLLHRSLTDVLAPPTHQCHTDCQPQRLQHDILSAITPSQTTVVPATEQACGGVSPGRRRLRGVIATTPHRSSLPGSYLWRDMEKGCADAQELWRDLIRRRATQIPWLRLATEELWLHISLAKANKVDVTCFPGIIQRCSTSYRHPHRPTSVPAHTAHRYLRGETRHI